MLGLSNSPLRTPAVNAFHSPGVNWSTGPWGALLSRTPIWPSGSWATSTQLLLEKLRVLLFHVICCTVLPFALSGGDCRAGSCEAVPARQSRSGKNRLL